MHVIEETVIRVRVERSGSRWCIGKCGCYAVAGMRGGPEYFLLWELEKTYLALGDSSTLSVMSSLTQLLCVASYTHAKPVAAIPLECPSGSNLNKFHSFGG